MSKYYQAMYDFERALLKGALVMAHGNISKAARDGGLHRNTLIRKIRIFKLAGAVSEIKKSNGLIRQAIPTKGGIS